MLLLASSLMFLVNACKKDKDDPFPGKTTAEYSHRVVTDWNALMFKLVKETAGFSPPVAARAFGYTGLAVYESVRPGMDGYLSLAGQINGLDDLMIPEADPDLEYNWEISANAATATILRGCFETASPANLTTIDDLESNLEQEFGSGIDAEIVQRSVQFGKNIGDAILAYANSDGQVECYKNNFPTSYTPPTGDGKWVPTPPLFQRALQPYWGDVRPFVSKNVVDALPPAPPVYSTNPSSKFYQEAQEVYNTVTNLTAEQLLIANYWSDDPGKTATPPGHSVAILSQVLQKENSNLEVAAEALAKIGIGVHDAFISCWKSKFIHNLVRPITVMQDLFDPAVTIPLSTPPFPEYTSGHSVQSGATAQILTDLFGENYAFTDRTHETRVDINGTPRSFPSFHAFADEAAISRLYGGIHYRTAIELGVVQGRSIGDNVNALKFKE